jgi:hypothetical protein
MLIREVSLKLNSVEYNLKKQKKSKLLNIDKDVSLKKLSNSKQPNFHLTLSRFPAL